MFRKILQGSAATPLLAQAFADTDEMLRTNEQMFEAVTTSLLAGRRPDLNIEYMDEDVNVAERTVRRGVFQHLTVNPKQDLTASLVLLSVVHDAERVGDYIKALLRVLVLLEFPIPPGDYRQQFAELRDAVRPMFGWTRTAFIDGNPDRARQVIATHTRNREKAWGILGKLVAEGEIGRRETIVIVAGGRNLKRVSAHLANIASSVLQPFDKIGSKDEDA